jgi:protein-glucosylgalactosylhydroxylysine glucosidase
MQKKTLIFLIGLILYVMDITGQAINRKALVRRHNVVVNSADSLSSLTIGNGKFAFTVDVTGLQSFPDAYARGVPLGTQSEWGWHSFPNTAGHQFESSLKTYLLNGKEVSYAVQWNEPGKNKDAANWFRQNPHRLQLGTIGFEFKMKNGTVARIEDIKNVRQELDLWKGEIHSRFTIDDILVEVISDCHPQQDAIGVNIRSELLKLGRLKIFFRFPYPTGEWADVGNNWKNNDKHNTTYKGTERNATILRKLDSTVYQVNLGWSGSNALREKERNYFELIPSSSYDQFVFVACFSPTKPQKSIPNFRETQTASADEWRKYWESGGAIDFSGSTDPRAFELERRIVLSQYLFRVQEAGSYPPQETGLTYNSWFGKPHLEMHWWHAVHYALWGRIELLEKRLDWYSKVRANAKAIAKRQGYEEVRWQKMTNNEGEESPSSVGSFLIWQQPHFIYFAELCYREHKNVSTLNKYKDLVFATADFMASFPFYEKENNRYILGKGVIPAQERFKPEETFNPTFELAYWYYGLTTAQEWRKRLGLPAEKKWDEVLKKLSSLPVKDNVYLAAESAPDSYTRAEFMTDHPSVLGAYGYLPYTKLMDTITMKKTFDLVWNIWHWQDTWGWDFPLTAMTAARLGLPERAMDALFMKVQTNTYLVNGHNYQDERLRIYMPGNGGLLTAVAMMCAGWDGGPGNDPGIPKKNWVVKWEGLRKMP